MTGLSLLLAAASACAATGPISDEFFHTEMRRVNNDEVWTDVYIREPRTKLPMTMRARKYAEGMWKLELIVKGQVEWTIYATAAGDALMTEWDIAGAGTATAVAVKDQGRTKVAINTKLFCEDAVITYEIDSSTCQLVEGTLDAAGTTIKDCKVPPPPDIRPPASPGRPCPVPELSVNNQPPVKTSCD